MRNGWTGGQYSVFRILLGSYLCEHFLRLLPWGRELFSNQGALPNSSASPLIHLFPNIFGVWDSPAFVLSLLALGAVLGLLLAMGVWDRAAAVVTWYLWACLLGRNPLIANPSLPYIGWLLLAHAVLSPAPYGSWAARGRADPRGKWEMPAGLFTLAWMVMAAGYSFSGYTKLISPSWVDGSALARVLENPLARPTILRGALLALPPVVLRLATWGGLSLELGFAPLALFRRIRPWLWGGMVSLHVGLLAMVDFADLTAAMLLVHFFTFDPAWIRPHAAGLQEWLFYDGHCGLCHRMVRFVLAEDRTGSSFRFAPLESAFFASRIPAEQRAALPDSIVVQAARGELMTRSAAILHVMRRLGGLWRILAALAGVIPGVMLDWCYDRVAGVRRKIFRAPAEACPILPVELRSRFQM
jgi:predicted DCC family thiol-disulfide oxidoreductase YuxK